MKILLVDDEREERDGIEFLIQKYRYPLSVAQASNGARALEYMEQNPVDILFTDVKMPVMDGLALAKAVNERYPQTKIIIFSAYGEFEYARKALEANAVSYLLKPIEIDEFRSVIEKAIQMIAEQDEQKKARQVQSSRNRQNLLFRVLTGAVLSEQDRETLSLELFQNGGCRLVYVEFADNFFEKWEELFLHYLRMYLGEQTEYINMLQNEAYLLIREKKLLDKEYLKQQIIKLSKDVAADTKTDLTVIVSRSVDAVSLFEQETAGIREILREFFGFGNQIIWTGGQMVQEHYSSDVDAIRRQLHLAIEAEHYELIRRYARELAEAVTSSHKVSRIYVQNIFYTVFQKMYDRSPNIQNERILNASEEIFYAKSARGMVDYFIQSMDEMTEALEEKATDDSQEIQKIKRLVEKEYMKDINLGYVAERVHLAPAYVSYIFKRETGQTLIKYITEIRMERARLLLEEDKLKIVQIARACGYENQSYFNRAFKNYFGRTPKQYKEGQGV